MIFRKAILLIHGFGGGIYDFGTLGNDLQMYLDFDVFTFTLPGHDKGYINNSKYTHTCSFKTLHYFSCYQIEKPDIFQCTYNCKHTEKA